MGRDRASGDRMHFDCEKLKALGLSRLSYLCNYLSSYGDFILGRAHVNGDDRIYNGDLGWFLILRS